MNIVEAIKLLKKDKNKLLDTTLQFVQTEIFYVHKDIAKIHLLSAEQAFISALRSNDPNSESRVGIGHLRDAFNAYQVYLDRGDVWLGIFTVPWNPIVKTEIKLKLASLSCIIAIIYEQLNDKSNYLTWKNITMNEAKEYMQNRPTAIEKWKNATTKKSMGTTGMIWITVEDTKIQKQYKEEIQFIKLFSEIVKEI
jgi:hypothetical protein